MIFIRRNIIIFKIFLVIICQYAVMINMYVIKPGQPSTALIAGQTFLTVSGGADVSVYSASNISDAYFSSQSEGSIDVIFAIRDLGTNEVISSQTLQTTIIALLASFPASTPSQVFITESYEFQAHCFISYMVPRLTIGHGGWVKILDITHTNARE